MPKSRGRKPKKQVAVQQRSTPNRMIFEKLDFGIGDRHEEFKHALLKSAREDVEKYPSLIEKLYGVLKQRWPENVLATFAF